MLPDQKPTIRPAKKTDRNHVNDLVQFGTHVHQHLDWRKPAEWIGRMPFFILEKNNQIVAALACSQDLENVGWIRLFATNSMMDVNAAWKSLWKHTKAFITQMNIHVAAIAFKRWFQDILIDSRFTYMDDVVLFSWGGKKMIAPPKDTGVFIRKMTAEDLPGVERVDHSAFEPLWQYSQALLHVALSKASIATVAERNNLIVGYQISTANSSGGHLARLAVLPAWQGKGIGYGLVAHLLETFQSWGTLQITVNTQSRNFSSLALYQKSGFRRLDESYPVFQFEP